MGLFKPSSSSAEITPIMYGAIADGYSHPASEKFDSLEAVQVVYPSATSLDDEIDMLAFEKAVQNHDYVKLPSGRYKFNRTVQIQDGNIIEGEGYSSCIIHNGAEQTFLFMINLSASLKNFKCKSVNNSNGILINGNNETNIENLMIDGFAIGIVSYNSSVINIKQCKFIDNSNTSISVNGSSYFNIDECYFNNNSNTAIYTDSSDTNISNCTFINISKGIDIFCSFTNINNCSFEYNNMDGRAMWTINIGEIQLVNITGCKFKDIFALYTSFISVTQTSTPNAVLNIYNNYHQGATFLDNNAPNVTVNNTGNLSM